ncbi:hypothetical protein SUGI_0235810 [Cryptomeria japonica]|nr:hypothetical protein SUGI_0235810 [Cryptomeria japonica]
MANGQLSPTFYAVACPQALSIVKFAVAQALGCDGSVLLDDTSTFTGEKGGLANVNSLRGFDVIDTIKSRLEAACTGVVSCADILAIAARDSVVLLGGPTWIVQLGRRDSTTASLSGANSNLPNPFGDLDALIKTFNDQGLSTKDMIVLSGAHTIGQARCVAFRSRIYNDTNIDSTFAASLKANCPGNGGDNNISPLDLTTPNFFDNTYYKNLKVQKGLLHSDQALFGGGSSDALDTTYSTNSASFFNDFATSMVNMGNINSLIGSNGEVRNNCRKIN